MLILKALLILFLIIQDHCSASPVMEEVIFYTVEVVCEVLGEFIIIIIIIFITFLI